MLKSKEIADFTPTELSSIHPERPIPADLHLYFKSNSHVLLWQPAGTVFSRESLEKYRKRGITQIWIHRSEWEQFSRFLGETAVEKESLPPPVASPRPPSRPNYTAKVSAQDIEAILRDSGKSDREKRALVARDSRILLGELASATHLEEQDIIRRAISKVVQDLVESGESDASGSRGTCKQIWAVAARDEEICHGINVSTTAVLFALAFGQVEETLLADIALAGLIHDIGMILLPYQLSQAPRKTFTEEQKREYLTQNDETDELIRSFSTEIPERATTYIREHHDHDRRSSPEPSTKVSQLVAMADFLDSICSGHWDGEERTFAQALHYLYEMELQAEHENRGRLFHPTALEAVVRWIQSNVSDDLLSAASAVVGEQARTVQKVG